MLSVRLVIVSSLLVMSCGGGKGGGQGGSAMGRGGGSGEIGDTHETDDPGAGAAAPDAAVPLPDAAPPAPPAVLIFKNENKKADLSLPLDKGWGQVVISYSGKPPKAKSALFFAKDCTAACDAEDPCPVCKESDDPSERQKAEKAETRREVIPAGGEYRLEWDGEVHVYEKNAKRKKCECWKKAAPEANTYTVKACGLRAAKKVGDASKMQCVETQVTLPLEGTGNEIVLSFP
jgi:hypothetical protein